MLRLLLFILAILIILLPSCATQTATQTISITTTSTSVITSTNQTTPPSQTTVTQTSPDQTETTLITSSPITPSVTTSPAIEKLTWYSMDGPPGGYFSDLVQNRLTNRLFALNFQGVHASEDQGETWILLPKPDGAWIESMSIYKDKLFISGSSLYYYDEMDNPIEVESPGGWLTISGDKIFLTRSEGTNNKVKIVYSDLTKTDFNWVDISLDLSVLELGIVNNGGNTGQFVRVNNIVSTANRMLLNILVESEGSGAGNSGYLFESLDGGDSWTQVMLDADSNLVIEKVFQDLNNPEHLILLFKHPVLHDVIGPISAFLRESFDGGGIWAKLTDLNIQTNGITDVTIIGDTYYFCSPASNFILKIEGSNYEILPMPKVAEFDEMTFWLNSLIFDVNDSRIVYGRTGSAWALGLVKSEDGMQTWKKMDRGIVASSPTIVIAHPSDPDTVYTSGNIIQESYATRDGGQNWEPFTPVNAGDDVKIDPHNPDHLLLMDENTTLFESYNGGRTFSRIAQNFSSAKIFDFEITPDGTIYVSNIGVGISEKTPGDPEWRYMTNSPDYAYDIVLDPDDSNVFYATYSPKIFEDYCAIWKYSKYQEDNYGWTEILHINGSDGVTWLEFDPSDSNKLYAGVIGENGTIYFSDNKGETWSILNEDLTFTTIWGHSQLQVDPLDANTVYAGTWGGGAFKTTNGGQDWLLMDEEHTFSSIGIAISSSNPDILYSCDRTAPVIHRSSDGGSTWEIYYEFSDDYMLASAVAIDPNNADVIYAAAFKPPLAHYGALVKIDKGQVIADIGSGLPRAVLDIELDEERSGVIYVTTHVHGVYKSVDDGNNWQQLDDRGTGLPRTGIYDIDIDPQSSNTLYATALCGELPDYMMTPGIQNLEGKCGVYKSTDGGESWKHILETVSEARGLDIDKKNSNNLYVADMMGGVWISNDAGVNWRQENDNLGSISMTSVKVKDSSIYAATQGSGVYSGNINTDGSITWIDSRSNKPSVYVSKIQIEVDPQDSNRIYASAYPGGLLRSDDGGKTWNDKNFLTPSIHVDDPSIQGYYSLDINPQNTENVWLGVYGKGMFVSYDGMDFDMLASGNMGTMIGKPITSVKINPQNSDEIYVGTQEGVYVSRNKGESWEPINNGLDTLDVRSIKLVDTSLEPFEDDFEEGILDKWWVDGEGWSIVADNGGNVLSGTGHSWINAGLKNWKDYAFEFRLKLVAGGIHVNFRTSDEGRYFLGVNQEGLYLNKQFNQWSEFAELDSAPQELLLNQWYDIIVRVDDTNIKVYMGESLVIDYSDSQPILDGAIAFETLEESQVYIDNVVVTFDNSKSQPIVYAGTGGYGIYTFKPWLTEWQHLGRTLGTGWWSPWERRMYQFSSILFDPKTPGKLYLGHFPSGFFISEDDGHSWHDSSIGLGNDGIFSLTMHPVNTDILFAGTYNGIVKSTDKGKTWTMKSNGMEPEQWPYTVAIDTDNPNIMYASTKNGQNKGFCSRNEFCGVVVKSIDGGESWFEIMNGLEKRSEFYSLIIYPLDHNILFLSTNRGIYLSMDAGSKWETINSGLPSTDNQVRDNVADNLVLTPDNNTLILGLMNHGVWKMDLAPLKD